MNKKTEFLSLIIPLYNEQKRLIKLLDVYRYLRKKKFSWEIILVNDGSIDETTRKVKDLVRSHNLKKVKLISYSKNKGKGFAIKSGMLKAKGNYRLFTDIDLSTPINEFDKFLPYLQKYDVVIGSRKMSGSKVIVHQPRMREKLGKGFTKLSQITLQINIKDFTCGFKCLSQNAAMQIFEKQVINGWGFDSEILFLAKKFKYKVREIPVKWINDPRSRVKFPRDIITSLTELIKIRLNDLKNVYS